MRRELAIVIVVGLGVLCLAPTPGDVGGCGREPELLDERAYAETRRATDCTRCTECGLTSQRCAITCRTDVAPQLGFPEGCTPLLRDGEVCVRALKAASCESYAIYLSDDAPQVPSECQFCRPRALAPVATSLIGDAGK